MDRAQQLANANVPRPHAPPPQFQGQQGYPGPGGPPFARPFPPFPGMPHVHPGIAIGGMNGVPLPPPRPGMMAMPPRGGPPIPIGGQGDIPPPPPLPMAGGRFPQGSAFPPRGECALVVVDTLPLTCHHHIRC